MFGSLFDVDETYAELQSDFNRLHVASSDFSHSKQHSRSKKTYSMEQPPEPRTEVKLCGLDNLGATCYLNTLLQILLYTPEFRDALFKLEAKHIGSLEDKDQPDSNVRLIPIHLQRLFARLLLGDVASTSVAELAESFGWNIRENFEQQDVQELYHMLLGAIEESLVYTPGKDIVSETFRGKLVNRITCLECGDISESKEDFLAISVSLSKRGCLEGGLSSSFVDAETLKGDNSYKCNCCSRLVNAKKETKLHSLPPILAFSLQRFSYSAIKSKSVKDKRKFKFSQMLDVAPYCEMELPPEETIYKLYAVVIHHGTPQSGHYYANIGDIDRLGYNPFMEEVPLKTVMPLAPLSSSSLPKPPKFYDDSKVLPSKDLDLSDPIKIVSFILSCVPDEKMRFIEMERKILEVKGMSWTDAFRSEYGPLPRFILKSSLFRSNKDVIMFNIKNTKKGKKKPSDSNSNAYCTEIENNSVQSVVLDGYADNGMPMTNAKEISTAGSRPQSPKCNIASANNCENESIVDTTSNGAIETPTLESSTQALNWFNFNDNLVQPILSSDLERFFDGEESAYMLLYRQKSLKRPLEGIENPYFGVPEPLIQLIHDENKILQNNREEYNLVMNTITIFVHLGSHYTLVDGSLVSVCGNKSSLTLKVNKKCTLAELYKTVGMACNMEAVTFTLTVAKVFNEGLHLYESITEGFQQRLIETELKDQDHLFLWDDQKVGGYEILMRGATHEPVQLKFNCTAKDGKLTTLSHSFPKSSTLACVVITIAEKLQTGPERLLLKHGSYCSNFMDEATLVELDISDNYCMDTEILNSDYDVKLAKDNQVCLTVKNNFEHSTIPDNAIAKERIFKMPVKRTMAIGELKRVILNYLNLASSSQCRLAVVKDDFEFPLPLFEDKSINESNLSGSAEIILEKGLPPRKEQITLRIMSLCGEKIDLNVSKYMAAEKCLQMVIRTAHLEGSNWCLRPKMWSGDGGKTLPNSSSSLLNLGIHHGATLIVEQRQKQKSSVPIVTLTIWFYPTLSSSSTLQSELNSKMEICDELMTVCPTEPTKLGELCIPVSTKLDELKQHILAMPLLAKISPPNLGQMRIRTLIEKAPGKVLRGYRKMLKSLKIVNNCQLCVQLLSSNENLSVHAVVLSVMQRLPDVRGYQPPLEIILDSGDSMSVDQFKKVLSGILKLTDNIHVAKKDVSRCEWIIIKDFEFFTEEHLRHKSAKNPRNVSLGLTVGNVTLFDGDILGIKDMATCSGSRDDFNTDEDDVRQHDKPYLLSVEPNDTLSLEIKEKNSGSRQSKVPRTCGNEPIQAKPSSQGISIHVGTYSHFE